MLPDGGMMLGFKVFKTIDEFEEYEKSTKKN